MLPILRAKARHLKGRVASSVLAELVGPEVDVGSSLVDPVGVHVVEQVVAAEVGDELADGCAVVGDYWSVWAGVVGRLGWVGVVLAVGVAVLGVRSMD